jgi:hypothetical protein
MKYICKKLINHQIKKCLLFRCLHAVVIYFCSRYIFEISEDDHPPNTPTQLVSARDN